MRSAFGKHFFIRIIKAARLFVPSWQPIDIAVIVSEDAVVRDLNHRYRKLDCVTDVLSFSYPLEPGEKHAVGEVYIARGQAERQAARYKTTLEAEIARLAIHGILHVQGYDHVKAGERKIMRSFEQIIMKSVMSAL